MKWAGSENGGYDKIGESKKGEEESKKDGRRKGFIYILPYRRFRLVRCDKGYDTRGFALREGRNNSTPFTS